MLEKTKGRALPVINRTVEFAPAVQACCGVCRSCVTTNIFTAVAAAATGAAYFIVRRGKRFAKPS